MGCCVSSNRSSPSQPRHPGRRPSNTSQVRHDPHSAAAAASQHAPASSSNLDGAVPSSRPNQPLRAPSPVRKSPKHVSHIRPPWTRATLEQEREAFFDTRVTGRPEVWNAMRLMCEVLRQGDVAQAQGILDALGMSCPNGRVAVGSSRRGEGSGRGGVYDEMGNLYEIPGWVVSDPEDLVEGGGEGEEIEGGETEDDDDDVEEEEAIKSEGSFAVPGRETGLRKEEKGKGKEMDPGETVTLTARLSDREGDVKIQIGMKQKTSVAASRIRERVGGSKKMRLFYLGRSWELGVKTLEEEGYVPGHVINCMLFDEIKEEPKRRKSRRN